MKKQDETDLSLQPKQQRVIETMAATEVLFGGAAGGGKSHLLRIFAIFWCLLIPGLQVYLFRRKSNDLFKNHMEGPSGFPSMLAREIEAKRVSIDYSKLSIKFKNGAKIHLCHCQHEKDRFNYQGAEIHILLIDELTHFTEKIYRYLRGRVRIGSLEVPAAMVGLGMFPRILCGSNPGGIGHNWVKQTFIDFAPEGVMKRMRKAEGGMVRLFIRSLLEDNPKMLDNDPDYADRLDGLGDPTLVKAMKDGDWDIVSGGALDDVWKRDKHVIPAFAVPPHWYIDRSFDWGSSAPFSVGFWAESDGSEVQLANGTTKTWPRGTLFRFDEWYGWNGKANVGCKMLAVEVAKGIKQREIEMYKRLRIRVKPGPADTSIFDTENGVCIAKDMEGQGIRWTKANKSPGSRINGLERVRKYLKAATQFPLEEPGMFVFEHCTHFIRTMPTLPRDERKRDDVDTDSEDHLYDEVRYRVGAAKAITTSQEV